MNWENNITKQLNIKYPVIQAPMLGVSTPEMAAAVSNESGLGSIAVGGLSPAATAELIRKTKQLTDKPFAVNLFAHAVSNYENAAIEPMKQFLLGLAEKRGYQITEEDLTNFHFYEYQDQIDILIQEKIPVVSFTFGTLDKETIHLLKENGSILIGTATCLEEALILESLNIDMITLQGIEAGGHRGTFIENKPLPQIGLFSLLPQVIKEIKIPVIAAGGINNPQSIKAAFDLGAGAVQIGTAFIAGKESEAIPSYQQKLHTVKDTDIILTRAFSGRWARGIHNEFIQAIESSCIDIPPYPIQNSLTSKFRKLAQQANDSEYTNLWAGQSANSIEMKSSAEIFLGLVHPFKSK